MAKNTRGKPRRDSAEASRWPISFVARDGKTQSPTLLHFMAHNNKILVGAIRVGEGGSYAFTKPAEMSLYRPKKRFETTPIGIT